MVLFARRWSSGPFDQVNKTMNEYRDSELAASLADSALSPPPLHVCSPPPSASSSSGASSFAPSPSPASVPSPSPSSSSSSSSTPSSASSSSSSSAPLTPPPTPPTVFSPCQMTFREAVQNGDTIELQRILEEREGKININLFDMEGQTALHHSCFMGNLELVKLLVRFGADIRLANRDGWNPLHIATFEGHNDILLYLMTVPGRRS